MQILFLLLAALAIVAACNVILQRNPIYSAIGLIVTLCALAGLFLTLSAPFIAAIQIVVYAGAIMVLFVFVIMLLNVRAEEAKLDRQKYLKWLAIPLFFALLAEVFYVIKAIPNLPPAQPLEVTVQSPAQVVGTTESIGYAMFTTYLLPFEAASVLILMAIVGSMLLARKETRPEAEREVVEVTETTIASPDDSQVVPTQTEEAAAAARR
jgi:NADH-quinone oxidoreductase subunit J